MREYLMQYNQDSHQFILQKIGQKAKSEYGRLRENFSKYIYFERIKIKVANDSTINYDTRVQSFTDVDCYLLEVIAFIMKHLKETLLHQLRDQNLKASDFDWVITVPAIWKARARRMMREAAYLAGLTCDNEGITKFTDTSRGTPPWVEKVNPHKPTLVLEPEAAAIYAHKYSEMSGHAPPLHYMVVDVGSTVDITVHKRSSKFNNEVVVKLPPFGNTWGGATVNQAFQDMIEDLVQDKGHQRFLDSNPTERPTLNKLYYEEFEEQKKAFGDQPTKTEILKINLPQKFIEFYKTEFLETRAKEFQLKFNFDTLHIPYDILEGNIFRQPIDNIISCVKSALDQVKEKVDTIYLVGGFGGCQYMENKIKEALASERGTKYDHIIRPPNADLAVTIGAVMWRQAPDIIQSRIADATYGIGVAPIFNPSIHDEYYWFLDEDGNVRCRNVFQVLVHEGEVVSKNVCYKISIKTFNYYSMSLIHVYVPIYATTEDNVKYTVDKEGKLTVTEISELKINTKHAQTRQPKFVKISIEFIGNEILVTGAISPMGEVVRTVCDPLSYRVDNEMSEYRKVSLATNYENLYKRSETWKQQTQKPHEDSIHRLQMKQDSYTQLEKCHTQLEENPTQIQEDHRKLEQSHAQVKVNYTQLQKRHTQLEKDHRQVQEDRKKLEQRNAQVTVNYTQLQKRHTQLEEDHTQLQEDHRKLEQSHTQIQVNYTQLQKRHTQLEKNHTQIQENHTQLEEDHKQLQQNHIQLQQHRTQLEQSHTQLHERLEELQHQLQLKENELGIIHSQLKAKGDIKNWTISHKELIITNNELGRGGWGAIMKGQLKVAVKQIHESIVSQYTLEQLNREIITMAQLRHPNLLQFIGAVFDHPSGNPMIITEVMDTSLRKAYEEKELIPDQQPVILSIMRDVAVGLNYLHSLPDPIIHRDVSSANVLLNRMGLGKWQTKISDLGSAKIARYATTQMPGALVYSAPELFRSITTQDETKQTTKLDVFSYGILLCEMATCTFQTPLILFVKCLLNSIPHVQVLSLIGVFRMNQAIAQPHNK